MTSKFLLLWCLIISKERALASINSSQVAALSELALKPDAIAKNSCTFFNLYKNLFEEMNSPSHPRIQVYYNRMIQKLYDTTPAHILFQQLWRIYKKCDEKTFVAMVRAQLSLFWQHNMNEYADNDYLLMVANGFYRIRNFHLYSSLNGRTQLLFERALKSLPDSLHHLFGFQEFCLMNRKYEEIFYLTEGDDFTTNEDVRFAFTWHLTKRYHAGNNKIIAIFEDFNVTEDEEILKPKRVLNELDEIPLRLNVALVAKHFNSFYGRWPSYNDKVGGNKTELLSEHIWQQDLNIWTVQLVADDHLVFSQQEFIMCATLFYDNKRRFVFGLKNRTALDEDCQWSAGKCDRR